MSRAQFTVDEVRLLRQVATTDRLERLVASLVAGERLSSEEINEVRDAAGDRISIDPDPLAISEEGRAFDDLLDRVAEVGQLRGEQ